MKKIVIPLPPCDKEEPPQAHPWALRGAEDPSIQAVCGISGIGGMVLPRGQTVSEPVTVKCLFYMPTHRRVDLTNLLEAIDDVLVHTRVLEDDNSNIIVSHDGSRVLYDKENPRTEVYICRYE